MLIHSPVTYGQVTDSHRMFTRAARTVKRRKGVGGKRRQNPTKNQRFRTEPGALVRQPTSEGARTRSYAELQNENTEKGEIYDRG